jgi:hypothetical protein
MRRGGTSKWVYGCLGALLGCGFISVLAVVLLIPLLPMLVMQAVGFQPQGSTDSVFAEVTPQPTLVIVNATIPEQVSINVSGQEYTLAQSDTYDASVGQDSTGVETALISVDQNGLYQEICRRDNTICDGTNGQYQLTGVDFRPGGAVLYATVTISGFTQQIGAVLLVDASGRRFTVAGIDVNGQLFAAPNNDIAQVLTDIEARGNDALSQFTLQANGRLYTLASMIVDDNYLTLTMQ